MFAALELLFFPLSLLTVFVLLPLQIMAALTLALVLMRPAVTGGTAGRTVLIFDVSGSMQAETAGRSRIDLAKDEALRLIRSLRRRRRLPCWRQGRKRNGWC